MVTYSGGAGNMRVSAILVIHCSSVKTPPLPAPSRTRKVWDRFFHASGHKRTIRTK